MAQPANAAFVAAQPALVVAEARKREAQEYFKREQWEAAVAAFGEALATVAGAGDSEKAAQLRLAIALNLALAALRSGDAAKAASACEDALALDGGNLKALYRRGVARGQLEDWTGAAADLEAVAARAGEGGVAAAARQALAALRDQQAAAQRGERDAEAEEAAPPKEAKPPPKYLTAPPPPRPAPKVEAPPPPTLSGGFLKRAREAAEKRKAAKKLEAQGPKNSEPWKQGARAALAARASAVAAANDASRLGVEERYVEAALGGGGATPLPAPPSPYTVQGGGLHGDVWRRAAVVAAMTPRQRKAAPDPADGDRLGAAAAALGASLAACCRRRDDARRRLEDDDLRGVVGACEAALRVADDALPGAAAVLGDYEGAGEFGPPPPHWGGKGGMQEGAPPHGGWGKGGGGWHEGPPPHHGGWGNGGWHEGPPPQHGGGWGEGGGYQGYPPHHGGGWNRGPPHHGWDADY